MRAQDRTIQRIAARDHGTVSRVELLAAGVSRRQIAGRRRLGAFIAAFPGVYYVGYKPRTVESRYMAAVKACGPEAVLSGMAAAWLWELLPRWWDPPRPVVTASTERRIPGITTRRRRTVDPRDSTRCQSIPVTTIPTTLIHIASLLSFDDLGRAVHEAGVKHKVKGDHIVRALDRRPTAKSRQRLLAIARGDAPIVLSRLERLFLRLLRAHDLVLPETNRPSGAGFVDCRWPAQRLTVELDSYRFHSSRHAWEKDHRREREARARGDEFRRYTWFDVVEEPIPTVGDLRKLLGA